MALFTDGTISTIEDLAAHDSAVLDVASTETIDLTTKLGLAQDQVGVELSTVVPELSSIVATTPLRLWHAFHTLALVYADAYHRQLNDRYRAKRNEYRELAQWAREKLLEIGVGIVSDPVPKAGIPVLGAIEGQQAAATYYATASWVSARGEEGAAASPLSLETGAASALSVRAVNPPANAAGWNVFVGLAPDAIFQQNTSLLGLDAVWVQTLAVSTSGRRPGTGQEPERFQPAPRILQRG